MGASQSKPEDSKVFTNETPIQFSQDLVNHLSDKLVSPETDATRQHTLDEHVRTRIHAELARLQSEDALVRQQIENALEKENLDRETALDDSASSAELHAEIEQVQKRAERFITRKQLDDFPEVKEKQHALLQCYRANRTKPLDCWLQVEEFKEAVAVLEKVHPSFFCIRSDPEN
ncbi:hypothetical protein FRB99_002063 [Tulasnella sp. 403]|nr:hypothetical protein FRB99_002063 [Tulasnella sp. 403]